MALTATIEAIKAYLKQTEKGEMSNSVKRISLSRNALIPMWMMWSGGILNVSDTLSSKDCIFLSPRWKVRY